MLKRLERILFSKEGPGPSGGRTLSLTSDPTLIWGLRMGLHVARRQGSETRVLGLRRRMLTGVKATLRRNGHYAEQLRSRLEGVRYRLPWSLRPGAQGTMWPERRRSTPAILLRAPVWVRLSAKGAE
eukprot:scaffold275946_cov35-Tisochrysis_lutea.AAC.2